MELHQLRSFVAVADGMHVGQAARRLHVAQPTLSRQIAALERDLGVELFSRARRRLALTSAGEVFLAEAREILQRADKAKRDAQRAARGEVGTLRLGYVQSATYDALPRIAGPFRSQSPGIRLDVQAMTTLRQIAALRAGTLDVGLLRPQQPSARKHPGVLDGLRTSVLSHDDMLAVLPAGHPLADQDRIALADLRGEAFLLYAAEAGSSGYDVIVEACLRAGFMPDVVQHPKDAATLVALVAAGLGISIMISPGPPIDPALIAFRPLADDLPTWDLALAWSPDNPSTALARFLTTQGLG
ncbi:LysR substrate-binding domain-containing protein [Actinopolymorpha cephalotaxi]|uniref:DNA-binding transcriptional LysR family regulator n=2 Tax=Actinopolymorpha cephalotaxi TaxID=504797 RepID=A0ABX2SAW3_9ACTN|nr:LysR substrate-binding domain-containing protein [Actinopolymorpha cephalotaxi]NYH86784.1 DNA-binding transcriptional LysR family regulator [Actinopolymorpha cephalotaxi]